jgi:DNA primase
MNPKVVPLPAGVDPAEYIQTHGAAAWKELLKESQHFILHQLYTIDRQEISAHMLAKVLRERLFPYLVRVQSPVEQGSYLEAIAQTLAIPKDDIVREIAQFASHAPTAEQAASTEIPSNTDTVSVEERFIALVTRYPTKETLEQKDMLTALAFDGHVFAFTPVSEEKMIELLALAERDYGYLPDEEKTMVVAELAKKLEGRFYDDLRAVYSRLLETAERSGDESGAHDLMIKLQSLNQRRHESS